MKMQGCRGYGKADEFLFRFRTYGKGRRSERYRGYGKGRGYVKIECMKY
jgi:hypothetical protein